MIETYNTQMTVFRINIKKKQILNINTFRIIWSRRRCFNEVGFNNWQRAPHNPPIWIHIFMFARSMKHDFGMFMLVLTPSIRLYVCFYWCPNCEKRDPLRMVEMYFVFILAMNRTSLQIFKCRKNSSNNYIYLLCGFWLWHICP